ncbi:Rrf2 family transcriptional regulator [Methylogaea oryzae]|uniref:HTH-type transcriptional regulator NsrR n=1 Tax=Methylogaea oryzae TaxID=1295382 RepID=A0A8D5ALZ4_9GAMM|nr:Rrf2 family transcriptional regulator [Methylogaea oryzae]BBL72646.1 HTH-type transcriptional regulator NsrR [Methylogaea oryzae]
MQLTKHTDYALRVLIYLAEQPEATIGQMAEHYQISRNHLVKVVHALARKGFVATTRGKNGGVKLARTAALIGIGDVVRAMEPHFDVVECFNFKRAHCAALPVCGLKGALNRAADEFLAVLDQYTLADTIKPRDVRLVPQRRIAALNETAGREAGA